MLSVLVLRCVLMSAALWPGSGAQVPRLESFWDRFPDMWRGVVPKPSISANEVQTQGRFEDWRTANRGFDSGPSSSGRLYDAIRGLFSANSANNDDIRTAMLSLGAIGNVQPQMGRGQFSFSSLFPEFQMPLANHDWWNGPNVCVERKEDNLAANGTTTVAPGVSAMDSIFGHSVHINHCTHSADNNAYSCVTEIKRPNFNRKYTVKYQCCYGFARDGESFGCTKAIPMTNLVETLNNLKLTALAKSLTDTGLNVLLEGGNFTIFAPTNEAFEDYQRPSNEIIPRKSQDLRSVLRSHVISGLVRSSDFVDEEILHTLVNSSIRINLFATPGHVLTADCARVVSINNLAKNGVVHIVDRVIQPVTMTLEATLRADGRFGTLLQLLADAGLDNLLRDPGQHLTILAPTDEAFRLVERNIKSRLSSDNDCLKRVLQTHILANVICSAVIERNALTTNFLNKVVRFDRDVDRITVQNQTITAPDNMASNGMYHVLDSVIIPEEARSLQQIITDASLDSYTNMVQQAGFGDSLSVLRNATIFVPSNRAYDKMPSDLQSRLRSEPNLATDLLKYHTVTPAILLSHFKDNLEMQTQLNDYKLRMNIYEAFPFGKNIITVNCAKITVANLRGCDGTIHVLEKVLVPPTGDILHQLGSLGNFSKFLDGLRTTGLNQTVSSQGPVTVFAPTDAAFAALSPEENQLLLSNSTLLHSVLQLHIFPRSICCAGIMEDSMFFGQYTRSMNPTYSLPLHRTRSGQIKLAAAGVQKCDVIATNGIIHYIDRLVFPKNFL